MDLSEYKLEPLNEDRERILYRGVHANPANALPRVLVVAPAGEYSSPKTLARLEHEYSLAAELDPQWAVRPLALARHQGRTVLMLDDPGGEPLDRLLGKPMEVGAFLRLAIGIAHAVGRVHDAGLIHKDIKPGNVLAVAAAGQVRLNGFGIASRMRRERAAPAPPEVIAGTLAYMAPEQTGRMNRSIDSRSDLYALGVTLYELLTGGLPFTATDPMEWVHCHVARLSVPPVERREGVPGVASAIIMKLLAKTAEDRYQTAAGLASDLRRCLAAWEAHGRIDDFPLGEHDTLDRLLIPEKLYGREREIAALLASFDRVVSSGRPELVLVSGYSGIGKSSVVHELNRVLVPPRGLFTSGKFDQYKRDIPYSTLAQAFQGLIRSLLSKSEGELNKWREALHDALGPNGRLIVNLVPELQLIIGEPPPVPDLPLQDAQRRFQLVFRRFIGVFARSEHPLALFLDDLQWLDSATLDLIEDLLTQSDVRHLMLIGAYRDNEVNSSHPLMRKLEAIRTAGAPVQEIVLAPLTPEDLAQLTRDALHCEPERATALAELIHDKTAGNPFFAIQFIAALVEEGLLTFDYGEGRWSWDLNRIRAKGYTDNVVDLMVGKLNRLPIETQEALQQLACLGHSAAITTLALVHGTSEEEVHTHLWEASRNEMIDRLESAYRFIHDRVQEAAYALIPEEERAAAHLRIGRLLAAHTPPEKREEAIFELVNQLNRGAALITEQEEREGLAELNLIAGTRAKNSTAYASALTYLLAGAALLPEDCWERQHALAFGLELHRADCELCTGALPSAEERLAALATRAADTVQRAAVASRRVDLYTMLGASDRAVAVGLEWLRHVGIDWPAHPTEQEARREYERIWSQLGSRAIEDLVDLPPMQDPESLATLDVLTSLGPPILWTDENLYALAISRAVNLSLERGNGDAAPTHCVAVGLIAGDRFGDYDAGYRLGKMACDLTERRGFKRFGGKTYSVFALVVPWTRPVREGMDPVLRAIQMASEQGDPTFAAYACRNLISILLASADPLDHVECEAEHGIEFARTVRFEFAVDMISVPLAFVRTLRGETANFGSLDDGRFTERSFEERLTGHPALALPECTYWIRKLQARFFAGDYASAIEAAQQAERWFSTSASLSVFLLERAEYHLYAALSRAARCEPMGPDRYAEHREALAAHDRQLRAWAANCPENFEDRTVLVGAEIARIEGRPLEAMDLYERAIRSARANGFVHHEALANELAGRFYLQRGFETAGSAHLRHARACYALWGADGKVRQLDELYPHLRQSEPAPDARGTIGAPIEHLGLATILKMSHAVSGEIVLERLVETLLRTAIEHAGAERGLLMLPRGDELSIQAEANTSGSSVIVRLRETPDSVVELPESIVRYVARTRERVILDDALTHNPFSTDEYIGRRHARSVLCLPLVKQGALVGVLYLENNVASHVFTPSRIELLTLLASQAAISLENAHLYADLNETQAYLAEAQRLTATGSFGWKPATGGLVWSEELYRIFELDRAATPTVEFALSRAHPDDRNARRQFTERAAREPLFLDFEYRLLMPDGAVKHVHVVARPIHDAATGGLEYVGAITDVTAVKESRQALEHAYAEIRELKDQLQKENIVLREEIDKTSMFEEIVGSSQPLRAVLSDLSKVAPTDSTVLITGETGTGKELIARAIHKRSPRASRPFVSINCAAIPASLIASELFGHEKGAFTGALQQRQGRFELADGGTLFLDEVGELPAETQIMLLRVLQEHEFERVGGNRPIRVNVRVIAATNRDLQTAVADSAFRADLFYRLNVFPLEVPALRERRADIPVLVEYFIHRFAQRVGKRIRGLSKETSTLLQSYDWPGNIRELQNIIERAVILADSDTLAIDERWLAGGPPKPPAVASPPASTLAAHEKDVIEAALRESKGRVSGPFGAAARLGVPPSTLESKIKQLKIDKGRFK